MTKTTAAAASALCVCCGTPGALLMKLPCGAFEEFTPKCLAELERQVAHDDWANAQGLDN